MVFYGKLQMRLDVHLENFSSPISHKKIQVKGGGEGGGGGGWEGVLICEGIIL